MRTLVIGDIHGGLKALQQVLERAEAKPSDKLIFLGDFVDGWSESAQVIDFLIDLRTQQECIFIKGNHDAWCEDWLANGTAEEKWLKHGGVSTLESYKGFSQLEKIEHLDFFRSLHHYYVDEENRLFIHAGFTSLDGPAHEHYDSAHKWDRSLWEMALTMNKRITANPELMPHRLSLFKEIFIGHTPTIFYKIDVPMKACNVWNLDTGAAFTGRLSVMDIETKQFTQSDTLMQLYTGESGRNYF